MLDENPQEREGSSSSDSLGKGEADAEDARGAVVGADGESWVLLGEIGKPRNKHRKERTSRSADVALRTGLSFVSPRREAFGNYAKSFDFSLPAAAAALPPGAAKSQQAAPLDSSLENGLRGLGISLPPKDRRLMTGGAGESFGGLDGEAAAAPSFREDKTPNELRRISTSLPSEASELAVEAHQVFRFSCRGKTLEEICAEGQAEAWRRGVGGRWQRPSLLSKEIGGQGLTGRSATEREEDSQTSPLQRAVEEAAAAAAAAAAACRSLQFLPLRREGALLSSASEEGPAQRRRSMPETTLDRLRLSSDLAASLPLPPRAQQQPSSGRGASLSKQLSMEGYRKMNSMARRGSEARLQEALALAERAREEGEEGSSETFLKGCEVKDEALSSPTDDSMNAAREAAVAVAEALAAAAPVLTAVKAKAFAVPRDSFSDACCEECAEGSALSADAAYASLLQEAGVLDSPALSVSRDDGAASETRGLLLETLEAPSSPETAEQQQLPPAPL